MRIREIEGKIERKRASKRYQSVYGFEFVLLSYTLIWIISILVDVNSTKMHLFWGLLSNDFPFKQTIRSQTLSNATLIFRFIHSTIFQMHSCCCSLLSLMLSFPWLMPKWTSECQNFRGIRMGSVCTRHVMSESSSAEILFRNNWRKRHLRFKNYSNILKLIQAKKTALVILNLF